MKLEIKQTKTGTSLFDGKREICQFVTGARQMNEKYAKEIVKLFSIPYVRDIKHKEPILCNKGDWECIHEKNGKCHAGLIKCTCKLDIN